MDNSSQLNKLSKKEYFPELSEAELLANPTRKNGKAMFLPPNIEQTFASLPEETRQMFKIYNNYYERTIDTIENNTIEIIAHNILVSIKSGVSPRDLDPDELVILRKVYGNNWWKLAHLKNENDDSEDEHGGDNGDECVKDLEKDLEKEKRKKAYLEGDDEEKEREE